MKKLNIASFPPAIVSGNPPLIFQQRAGHWSILQNLTFVKGEGEKELQKPPNRAALFEPSVAFQKRLVMHIIPCI